MGAGREPHSHARIGPALELTPPLSLSLIATHIAGAFWRLPWPARRAWERQGGQGVEPQPLLPLSCPYWPSGSPHSRTSESRPSRAHGGMATRHSATGTTRGYGVRVAPSRGVGIHFFLSIGEKNLGRPRRRDFVRCKIDFVHRRVPMHGIHQGGRVRLR